MPYSPIIPCRYASSSVGSDRFFPQWHQAFFKPFVHSTPNPDPDGCRSLLPIPHQLALLLLPTTPVAVLRCWCCAPLLLVLHTVTGAAHCCWCCALLLLVLHAAAAAVPHCCWCCTLLLVLHAAAADGYCCCCPPCCCCRTQCCCTLLLLLLLPTVAATATAAATHVFFYPITAMRNNKVYSFRPHGSYYLQ